MGGESVSHRRTESTSKWLVNKGGGEKSGIGTPNKEGLNGLQNREKRAKVREVRREEDRGKVMSVPGGGTKKDSSTGRGRRKEKKRL